MNRLLPIAALALLSVLRPWPRAGTAPLAPERPLASLVPESCLVFLEARGVAPILEQGLEHPFVRWLRASDAGHALLSELPVSPTEALARADAWLGSSVLASATALGRRGIALGHDPARKKNVLLALGSDAGSVQRHLGAVLDAIERQLGWPGGLDQPHARWSEAEVWTLGAGIVARRDALLVLGDDKELVQEVLELSADPDGRGLLDRPGFAAHHAARPASSLWAWLELAELEPFADQGYRELRAGNRSPAVQGLLGARLGALISARALSAALSLRDGTVVELHLRASEAPCVSSLAPLARDGAVPAETRGEHMGQALLYRDYARFLSLRSELFPAETLPAFAETITNGALFFEGQDLGEEVMTRVSPWIRLEARELAFADGRRPEIPLPGLAAVAVLDDERAGEQWTAAFQTLISIINVDQAQKGGRSMRLHLEREGDVAISAARFPTPGPNDGVDVRYNLEPALAVVGRHLVLGTHESLVRALVRELAGRSPGTTTDAAESLALDARGLRTVVEQNFEVMVAQKMLEDGLGRAAAEKEIGGLRLVLGALEGARIELAGESSSPELLLELRLARSAATGEGTGR